MALVHLGLCNKILDFVVLVGYAENTYSSNVFSSDGQIINQITCTSGLTVNVSAEIRDGTITEINSLTLLQ